MVLVRSLFSKLSNCECSRQTTRAITQLLIATSSLLIRVDDLLVNGATLTFVQYNPCFDLCNYQHEFIPMIIDKLLDFINYTSCIINFPPIFQDMLVRAKSLNRKHSRLNWFVIIHTVALYKMNETFTLRSWHLLISI